MFFESCKSILYSDTLVPDIFITEYMPLLSSDSVKVLLIQPFFKQTQQESFNGRVCQKYGARGLNGKRMPRTA